MNACRDRENSLSESLWKVERMLCGSDKRSKVELVNIRKCFLNVDQSIECLRLMVQRHKRFIDLNKWFFRHIRNMSAVCFQLQCSDLTQTSNQGHQSFIESATSWLNQLNLFTIKFVSAIYRCFSAMRICVSFLLATEIALFMTCSTGKSRQRFLPQQLQWVTSFQNSNSVSGQNYQSK